LNTKKNQVCYFVRYIRVFVITVIIITEFDCISVMLALTGKEHEICDVTTFLQEIKTTIKRSVASFKIKTSLDLINV